MLLVACGGDDDAAPTAAVDTSGGAEAEGELTPDDVCALLSDDDISSVLGETYPFVPNDYPEESPFPGCSWRTGRILVQVAPGSTPVTAPGQECAPLDIGDVSLDCTSSIQAVVGDSRVVVSTIEDLTAEQLIALTELAVAKL